MKPTRSSWIAAASLAALLFGAGIAHTSRRPNSGGTLRIEFASSASPDPAQKPAGAREQAIWEKVVPLVFDRLTTLDDHGAPQPFLALSWKSDAAGRRWEFRLRDNVKFSDGSPLTAREAAAALAPLAPGLRARAEGDLLVIDAAAPVPDLPVLLGRIENSIYRRAPDGLPIGTGPFRVAEGRTAGLIQFTESEGCWGGRPLVDAIEVRSSRSAQERWLDIHTGKADVAELDAAQARRLEPEAGHVWASPPMDLLAIVPAETGPAADIRVRQALADSIDRASLAGVILQREAEPAGSLLPQWLSGYAFLFPTAADAGRARRLAAEITPQPALELGYDASDPQARLVAERVLVNASAAGLNLSLAGGGATPDVRLLRVRIASTEPGRALAEISERLGLGDARGVSAGSAQEIYAAERQWVDSFRVIPLVYVPELYAIAPRVRDWMPGARGDWRLADVWLEEKAQ